MSIRTLFPTLLYEAQLDDAVLLSALAHMARTLSVDDAAGRAWSRTKGYRGYTSYASLDDLPRRDPDVGALVRILDKHVAKFAGACAFDLPKKLKLDSLWINVLKPGGTHSGHIHPHSAVSGTIYVDVPPGASGIRFEDPRLPQMMAAPTREPDAPYDRQPFVKVDPIAGTILLWESWLRHEVTANGAKADRISISFNYG